MLSRSSIAQILVCVLFVLYGPSFLSSQPASMSSLFRHAWKAGSPPKGIQMLKSKATFDAVTVSAHKLQEMLTNGTVTSTELVQQYISRVENYNGYLNAISEYAPAVMQRAAEMDEERARGSVRGPLHGIPIVLKDNMCTSPDLGMSTTGGAVALAGAQCSMNAAIVDKLLQAGAIFLGKAVLSELNFNRDSNLPCGWSAMAGQCQSPYVHDGVAEDDNAGGHSNPGGSSTGCAVAVAAGLAPIAVGSDTDASLTAPGIRAGLYTLRPTLGLISTNGILPSSHRFDTAGPMAKTPLDLANLLDVLVDSDKTKVPSGGYSTVLDQSWKGLRIGALDPELWQYPDWLCKPAPSATEQIIRDTRAAYQRISMLADSFHENIELPEASEFMLKDNHSIYTMISEDHEADLNAFLQTLQGCKVKTLRELVEYNAAHSEEALTKQYPGQDKLIGALDSNLSAQDQREYIQHYTKIGSAFQAMCDKYDINVIIAPGDCFFCQYGTANGFPVVALPLTVLDFNGRPIGIQAIAPAHQEPLLLKLMSAWEVTFPRSTPTAFTRKPSRDYSL